MNQGSLNEAIPRPVFSAYPPWLHFKICRVKKRERQNWSAYLRRQAANDIANPAPGHLINNCLIVLAACLPGLALPMQPRNLRIDTRRRYLLDSKLAQPWPGAKLARVQAWLGVSCRAEALSAHPKFALNMCIVIVVAVGWHDPSHAKRFYNPHNSLSLFLSQRNWNCNWFKGQLGSSFQKYHFPRW